MLFRSLTNGRALDSLDDRTLTLCLHCLVCRIAVAAVATWSLHGPADDQCRSPMAEMDLLRDVTLPPFLVLATTSCLRLNSFCIPRRSRSVTHARQPCGLPRALPGAGVGRDVPAAWDGPLSGETTPLGTYWIFISRRAPKPRPRVTIRVPKNCDDSFAAGGVATSSQNVGTDIPPAKQVMPRVTMLRTSLHGRLRTGQREG